MKTPRYTINNYQEAKGTTFLSIDEDGEQIDALIAGVDPAIGYTVKNINDGDPEGYEWCMDLTMINASSKVTFNNVLHDLNMIAELIRVEGVVRWEDFTKASKMWDTSSGFGACPFN